MKLCMKNNQTPQCHNEFTAQHVKKKSQEKVQIQLSIMLNSRHDPKAAALLLGRHARPKVRIGCASYVTSLKT